MCSSDLEPPPPAKKIMGNIKFLASDYNDNSGSINKGKFMNFGSFYFRPNMSIICKRLGNLQNGDLEILFNKDAELDYLVIARNLRTARTRTLDMVSAIHNTTGDVKETLVGIDQNYVEIFPGDKIDFTFLPGPGNADKKAYILKSNFFPVKYAVLHKPKIFTVLITVPNAIRLFCAVFFFKTIFTILFVFVAV